MSNRTFGVSLLVALAVAAGSLVVAPQGSTSAVAPPYDNAVAQELATASAALAQASLLPDLLPVIPGLEANPAMVLGVHEIFADLTSLATSTDLATDIAALGGSDFTFSGYDDSSSGGTHTVTFDVAVDRAYSAPVTIMEDGVQILGAPVDVAVTMPATTVTLTFDESDIPGTFAFIDLPTFALTASLASNQTIPIQFGFADATRERRPRRRVHRRLRAHRS